LNVQRRWVGERKGKTWTNLKSNIRKERTQRKNWGKKRTSNSKRNEVSKKSGEWE